MHLAHKTTPSSMQEVVYNILTIFQCCRFVGTSGQNVDNIYRFSTMNDRLRILESTLHWRHMTPTAPDTLSETAAQSTVMQHGPRMTEWLGHQSYTLHTVDCSDLNERQ